MKKGYERNMREGAVNDGINDAQEKHQIALKHKITQQDIGTTRDAQIGSHNGCIGTA